MVLVTCELPRALVVIGYFRRATTGDRSPFSFALGVFVHFRSWQRSKKLKV